MAIAFGTSTTANVASSGGSFSAPSTSGSNIVGIVSIQGGTGVSVSSVTWGGTAMTVIQVASGAGASAIAYLKNASSAGSVVITYTGSGGLGCSASYYTGVNQTTPVEVSNTNNSLVSANITISLTTAIANDWLVGAYNYNTGTPAAGSNTFLRIGDKLCDTNAPQSTGSNSLNVTIPTNTGWWIAAVALSPFTAPPVNANFLNFM